MPINDFSHYQRVLGTYYFVLSSSGISLERSKHVRMPTSFHKVIMWSQYSCNKKRKNVYLQVFISFCNFLIVQLYVYTTVI